MILPSSLVSILRGSLVDLRLRALDNPSKLAGTQPPQGSPIGFNRARLDEHLPQYHHSIVPACRVGRAQETIGLPCSFRPFGEQEDDQAAAIPK